MQVFPFMLVSHHYAHTTDDTKGMKYVVIVTRPRTNSRAVCIESDDDDAAKAHVEKIMLAHNWKYVALFRSDCITPNMEDGYTKIANGNVFYGKVQWFECKD